MITTRFDEGTGILWVVVEGPAVASEIIEVLDELYLRDGARVFRRRLWDLRKSTTQLTPDEMRQVSDVVNRLTRPGFGRTVILTETDVQYGVARTMLPRVEGQPVEFQVVRTEQEAIAWLDSGDEKEMSAGG